MRTPVLTTIICTRGVPLTHSLQGLWSAPSLCMLALSTLGWGLCYHIFLGFSPAHAAGRALFFMGAVLGLNGVLEGVALLAFRFSRARRNAEEVGQRAQYVPMTSLVACSVKVRLASFLFSFLSLCLFFSLS